MTKIITSFAGLTPSKIDRNALDEKFNRLEYGDSEVLYISKEVFHHDVNNEDDGDFEYRYCIHSEDFGECGNDAFEVTLCLVPLTSHILESLESSGNDYSNSEDPIHSDWYVIDAVSEGYYVQFGFSGEIPYEDSESSYADATDEAKENAIVAANVFECANSLRGFFLDRYVNMLGCTGWDYLNEWCYDKGSAIDSVMNRYKDEKFKEEESILESALYSSEINFNCVEDIREVIAEHYKDVKLVDNKIDNGDDDEDSEDDYVMCACFEADSKTIRVYYGNKTFNIGYVKIEKD